MKPKTTFVCQNCGSQYPKWMGKCSSCGEWNTLTEELIQPKSAKQSAVPIETKKPEPLKSIKAESVNRIPTGIQEFDQLLGGGIVPGSVTLIGGEPGIGKSTLMLQLAMGFAGKVLYISGEESRQQIKMRADRLGPQNDNCYLLDETNVEQIITYSRDLKPNLVILDSVQTLRTMRIESSAGSISQIRESAQEFIHYAKQYHVPVLLIGHITKEGSLAGPKILEHMVDVVLQFEGENNHMYRILRAHKNRFGSTNELALFEMMGNGLREVSNPSEWLLASRQSDASGVAVAITIEGNRPLLIEVQALVTPSAYGTPQRSSTGFDTRRLHMLLAVLEKRCGLKLGTRDVFLNIAGGLKATEPAIDLAVISAIMSSYTDLPIDPKTSFTGEVGLSGEIRPIMRIEQRLNEARKLGFDKVFYASTAKQKLNGAASGMQMESVQRVDLLFRKLFAGSK